MAHGIYRQTGRGHNYRLLPAVWKAALAVAPGDLVYRDNADGYDKSSALFTWTTDLATTQTAWHDVFRGVSMARRPTTQTTDGGRTDGMILADGPFEFPCDALATAAKPGDLVTIAQGTGNTLNPQKVMVTTTIAIAIGRVIEDAPVGNTFLTFELDPALYKGGAQPIQ